MLKRALIIYRYFYIILIQATSQSERAKGGGYELEQFYPRWKRMNKSIDRYHFLLGEALMHWHKKKTICNIRLLIYYSHRVIIDVRHSVHSDQYSNNGAWKQHSYSSYFNEILAYTNIHHLKHLCFVDSYSKLMEAVSDGSSSSEKWLSKLTVSSWLTHVKEILNCGCLIAQILERVRTLSYTL